MFYLDLSIGASQVAQWVKNLPAKQKKQEGKRGGLIPVFGRSLGGEPGNPFQYTCLENPHGQESLVGYNPWDHKESDTTEKLSTCSRRAS